MTDRLTLTRVRGHGRHGVFAHERENGQPFLVDATLHLDLAPAGRSDRLEDTVDYGALASAIVAEIEGEPVDLVEALAERIAARCLRDPRVRGVEVTVHKPMAPVGVLVDDVAVTVTRTHD